MKRTGGSIVLTILFMTLVMFLGLSLLNVSILHNRINRARQAHRVRSEFLHNILIRHLHGDTEKIKNTRFDSAIEDIPDCFSHSLYPDICSDSFSLRRSFRFRSRDFGTFRMHHGIFGLDVSDPEKKDTWRSRSAFTLISGDIPFRLIPVIINPPAPTGSENAKYSGEIHTEEPYHIVVSDHSAVFNIRQYLADLLNLDPQDLSLPAIRSLYGTGQREKGIWLDKDRLDILPVFIQGDADHIRLGVSESNQVVEILAGPDRLTLRYSPVGWEVQSRDNTGSSSGEFLQKIIINGDVHSLESAGFPALADHSRPELIVLGSIVISSSITGVQQNHSGNESPFITIITSPSPFHPGTKNSSLYFSPAGGICVQGVLHINGRVHNKNPGIVLTGSLYCRNLENRGRIEVKKTPFVPESSPENFFLTDITIIRDIRSVALEEVFEGEK